MDLKTLEDTFLLCRDMRHQWSRDVTLEITHEELENANRKVRVLYRTTHCLECETSKTETILMSTYEVTKRTYGYPEGYQLTQPASFAELRAASIKRQVKKAGVL